MNNIRISASPAMYFIKWIDVKATSADAAKAAAEALNPGCNANLCSLMPEAAK
jgi:hypothetical protein